MRLEGPASRGGYRFVGRTVTLAHAVQAYVIRRRLAGSPFVSSEAVLSAFSRVNGDIELVALTSDEIRAFVSRPGTAQATQLSKFSVIKCFLSDCVERDLLKPIVLTIPAKPLARRVPYIYEHAEIRTLLSNTAICQVGSVQVTSTCLWLALLLLYSTGATLDEVLSLRREDVNLDCKYIVFRAGVNRPARRIPIGEGLTAALMGKLEPASRARLFQMPSGKPMSQNYLNSRFRRLLELSGIDADRNGYQPRLQDFRYTFAVHRLRAWVRAGDQLDQLTPSLSAYMGYSSLLKAEEFLAFAPDRFIQDLRKLSPTEELDDVCMR